MNDNLILDKIKVFADTAHGDQMRKYSSERYIVHPIRVMELCRNYNSELPVLAAALLHDVLEDTETGTDEILGFLSTLMPDESARQTLKLVKQLTDEYTKSAYPKMNRDERKALEVKRLGKINAAAQTIKYADIIDNTHEIVPSDRGFAPRYLKECKAILTAADKGNPELRKRAFEAVNSGFDELGKRS